MPNFLHLKPADIETREKRAQFKVCVVGCGQMGARHAVSFAEAGFRVACTDADQSLLKKFTKGGTGVTEQEVRAYARSGTLDATDDLKGAVAKSDIIVLSSSVKVDEKGNLDSSEIKSNCRQVGAGLQRGALVIFSGQAGFGFTEGVIEETLESASGFKSGVDFGLAYSQSQARETESTEIVSSQELIVAAGDKASLDAASLILSTTTKSIVKQIVNIKVAELATLFASASRNVATALANEFAIFCEKAGVDVFEVLRLLDSVLGETRYSPTVGGDGTKREMQFLLENAENFEVKLRLSKLAVQVNEDVVRHVVNLTQSALRDCGKTLRRARIAVFGADRAGESAEPFVKMLSAKGARINIYNPRGSRNDDSNSQIVPKRSLTDAVENCDCLVFLAAEEQFRRLNLKSLRSVMRSPAAVVDLVGWFERERVESEGFLYRGLGRGVERK